MTEEPLQVNLAVSLHAPNDALRSQLAPINDRYPIADVMAAVRDYTRAHSSPRHVRVCADERDQRHALTGD